jgi:hypothetical protein
MSVCSKCGIYIKVSGLNFCSKECMIIKKLGKNSIVDNYKGSFMEYVQKNLNQTEKELMKVKNKNVC